MLCPLTFFYSEGSPPPASHVVVRISFSHIEYKLEIPNNDVAMIFLAELKQAIAGECFSLIIEFGKVRRNGQNHRRIRRYII